MGVPTPSAAPSNFTTRRLRIPNDVDYLAIVGGLIAAGIYPDHYEDQGGISREDAAQELKKILLSYYDDPMIGMIAAFVEDSQGEDWLICDGATYARSDYPILYDRLPAALQISADEFITPNMSGRFPVGIGQAGAGQTNYSPMNTGGAQTVTLTQAQMPIHTHGYFSGTYAPFASGSAAPITGDIAPVANITNSAGGGQAHENRPPYFAVIFKILAR